MNLLSSMLSTVHPDKRYLMKQHLKIFYQLGITNSKGVPNPKMLLACKVLKIDLEDLEPKTYEDFLQKQHEEIYERSGEVGLRNSNLPKLAKTEY